MGLKAVAKDTIGTGTVTSVSVTTANGVSGSVANPTTTPAITLTLGDITPSNVTPSSGGAFRTGTSNGNTALLQARDVDGAAYSTFGTLTAGNTPSFAIAAPAGGTVTIDGATIGGTTAAAGSFTSLTMSTAGAFRTTTTNANTALLQAYDVDGAAYSTFVTLTAGNTPTFALAAPAGGTASIDGTVIGGSTAAAGTFTTAAATTSMTTPLVIGGSGTTQTLTYKTTTGVGASGADHIFQVGNNGATEAMRILNNGHLLIGTTTDATALTVGVSSSATGAISTIQQASTGDATLQFLLTGVQAWCIGIDNSDSDKLKIASANNGFSAPLLSMAVTTGDILFAGDLTLSTGKALHTNTSAGNTLLLQAYDVDGAAYTTFATLTANNTPTMDLSTAVTIGSNKVVGSSSSSVTDNTIVRMDSTTGSVMQSTGVTIDDSNALYGFAAGVNAQVGTTYTIQASDAGKIVTLNNGSAITVTLPNSLSAGFSCGWIQLGAGQVTFSAAASGTLTNAHSQTKSFGAGAGGSLYVDSNSGTNPAWYLFGDTGA